MGNEFQKVIDNDNLEVARNNLNEFTGKIKRRYEREIEEVSMNQRAREIDENQIGFINANPELTFEEMRLIKRFADYMKGDK